MHNRPLTADSRNLERLKDRLTTPGDSGSKPIETDTIALIEEAKKRFGDSIVVGVTPDALAWLLEMNSRKVDTLAPRTQLDALQACIETVVEQAIPGDFIEAGCSRGGQCVFASAVFKELGALDRRVIGADSFTGLPEPCTAEAPDDALFYFFLKAIGRFKSTIAQTCDTLRNYELLDDRFRILAGPFDESLSDPSIGSLAVIRLDATFYASTRDALQALYPRLSRGGFVLAADFGVPTGARRAIEEFRLKHNIQEPLCEIDGQGVIWRRVSM